MENQLQTVPQMSVNEIATISETFFKSGMFADVKSAQQAMVKIMAGAEVGLPPFQSMSGIHIIVGKPVIGSGLIASKIKGSGKYDYKVVESTDKNCSIDFYQGKEKIGNSSFSIAEAQKAQTKNLEKYPKNMLFARAISNGCKWYTPDVFGGPIYVPEEKEEMIAETVDADFTDIDEEMEREAMETLSQSTTKDELQNNWKSLGKEKQAIPTVLALKEKLKASL
jgi:hypothetical protein